MCIRDRVGPGEISPYNIVIKEGDKVTNQQQREGKCKTFFRVFLINLEPVCDSQTGTSECGITGSNRACNNTDHSQNTTYRSKESDGHLIYGSRVSAVSSCKTGHQSAGFLVECTSCCSPVSYTHLNGGLVHLGNVPLFLAAIIFGKRTGALAGSIGMALFDLMGGWVLWAPFTFVVVGLMGYSVGAITEKHHGFRWNVLAIVVACVLKIVGYYIAEGIIYGNWIAPAASIPGNLVQIGVAAVLVLSLIHI